MRSSLARRRSSPRRRSAPEPADPRALRRFVVSPEALQKYGQEADDGLLTSKILFKMKRPGSGLRGAAETSLAGAAADVARAIDCGAPSRVFRAAGKFEDAHVASRVEISDPPYPETKSRDRTSAQVAAGLDLWYAVDCGSEPAPRGLARAAAAGARVEDWMPDDPLFSKPTADAINLRGAWDATAGSPDVVVQVVDDGVDVDHPDLERNVWTNPGEVCGNGVDDDGNGYVDDCRGYNHADDSGADLLGASNHGTHCAGVVGAASGNGLSIAGVAGGLGSPGARLMTSVVFGKTRSRGYPDAIAYGADHGAHVCSLSWTFSSPDAYNQAVLDAIDYAVAAGVVVVAAAGNGGSDAAWYPAAYGPVVAVTATDRDGDLASFANRGAWVDVAAPGERVVSTVPGGGVATMTGTSMAAPLVAGVVALALATGAPGAAAVECLLATAKDLGASGAGAGAVHARRAVRCAAPAPSAAPTVDVEVVHDGVCVDSSSWFRRSKKGKLKTCAWAAKKPGKRCAKADDADVRAVDACRAACASIWPNTLACEDR